LPVIDRKSGIEAELFTLSAAFFVKIKTIK